MSMRRRFQSSWAFPPGLPESGVGILETLAGLLVFVLLAIVGTRAYQGVVHNQKEAAQVKALTDAVTTTAEALSALTVKVLTEPGSKYLSWSVPAPVASGEYDFRYRTVPRPAVGGTQDTSVVGLEVQVSAAGSPGGFSAVREFATLISPHLNSRDRLGQVSTKAERDAEESFYNGLQARIHNVEGAAKDINQVRLNSFSCYDKGQCCGFMEAYFMKPDMKPVEGLDEKCYYRCAMQGDVKIKEWNAACGTDFCKLAPWRTKEDCCAAIAAGTCKPGTICANVCVDCVGEDGSTCKSDVKCDDGWFNDFFDCSKGTLCNGDALPDVVPEWGNVKAMCKTSKCAAIAPSCESMAFSCCNGYWQRIAAGLEPWAGSAICAKLVTQDQCCNTQIGAGYYNFTCGSDGRIMKAQYYNKSINFCGAPPGTDWDKYCLLNKGCASTFSPPWASGGCGSWAGMPNDPWIDPDVNSGGTHGFPQSMTSSDGTTTTGGETTSKAGKDRTATDRDGVVKDSKGGRE